METSWFMLPILLFVPVLLSGQKLYEIDASDVMREPETGHFRMGNAGPQGQEIRVNSLYLTKGGKPILPVMGEMHFSRIRHDQWQDVILKMKACGINIVSTYLFWNHHEEIEGQFDWEGEKDIRAFVRLCASQDMDVIVRLGPWSHGEARNGGTPDWILRKKFIQDRSNDVVYQYYVKRYFGEIASQLEGLYYKDGGPVVGIQLENEYWYGKAGEAHIKWLKETAIELGIDVPLYTVTGWGNGSVPPFEVIPLWGAYADAPWSEYTGKIYQPENYMFDRFRDNKNIGNDRTDSAGIYMSYEKYPYFTCEVGIGVQNTYHRRLVVSPLDGSAMMTAKLGSGSNLLGWYVFAGATQFRGLLHSTEEEQEETGYWSRVPKKSYDFQAAIRESGELSKAYKEVKKLHYFVDAAGEKLAPMMPEIGPGKKNDLQLAVRADEQSGFLFGINYGRYLPKEARKKCRFQVRLKHEKVVFPRQGVDIPDSAVFIWPLNYDLEGVKLKYATAQLLGKTDNCYLFFQNRDIPVELAFDASAIEKIETANGKVLAKNGLIIVSDLQPGKECLVTLTMNKGETRKMIVFTECEADNCWILGHQDKKEIFISKAGMYSDHGKVSVYSSCEDMQVSRLNPDSSRLYTELHLQTPVRKDCSVTVLPHPLFKDAAWLETANFKEIQADKQRFHRFFFKEFSLENPSCFRKVTLYIFPEADCRINLNDKWVQQEVKAGELNRIDLTGYAVKGENMLFVDFPYTKGLKCFGARMVVEYSNYDRIEFSTDSSWLTADMYTNPTPLKPMENPLKPKVAEAPSFLDTIALPDFREWDILVPYGTLDGLNQIFLKIRYKGDRAELYHGTVLSADHFNDNRVWSIGLRRQERPVEGGNLRLVIYGPEKDKKIFFDVPPAEDANRQAELLDFKAVPEYKITLD